MRNLKLILVVSCFQLFQVLSAQAWGPITHIGIALEKENGATNAIPKEYLADFLAGCTEPDIGAGNGSIDKGVSEAYEIYHDPLFVEAMLTVAKSKTGSERQALLARARGFQVHQMADFVAHTATGYPNSKQFYHGIRVQDEYMPNHIANELSLDVLAYNQSQKAMSGLKLNFVDAETLVEIRNEYAKTKGIDLKSDQGALNKDILTLKGTVTTEFKIAESLRKNNPKRISEMNTFFSDRFTGVNGKGGLNDALKAVKNSTYASVYSQAPKNEKAGGLFNLVSGVVGSGVDIAMMSAEDIAVRLVSQNAVSGAIKSTVNSRVQSKNTKLIANLVFNLLVKNDASFREVIYTTEQTVQGPSDKNAQRLEELQQESEFLQEKVDKAKAEYDNRPWWKFWLIFTNSDKKKYEALKIQYDAIQTEIVTLSDKVSTPTGAASSGQNASSSTSSPASTAGAASPLLPAPAPGTELYTTYQDYAEAVAKGDPDATKAAQTKYLDLKAAYEQKAQIK